MTGIRLVAMAAILGLVAACAPVPVYQPPVARPGPEPAEPEPSGAKRPDERAPAPKRTGPMWPGSEQGEAEWPDRDGLEPDKRKPSEPFAYPRQAPTKDKPMSQWPPDDVPRTAAEASGAAVMALLQQAERLAAAGKYRQAGAAIERAMNIEPRNPFIYQRLARIRLQQGQPRQAEALARKSNSLGRNNPYLQADNWALIAEALRAQGKLLAAESAAGQAAYLRSRLR